MQSCTVVPIISKILSHKPVSLRCLWRYVPDLLFDIATALGAHGTALLKHIDGNHVKMGDPLPTDLPS